MPTVYRVQSHRDLLAVIPALIGFTPHDSIVVCGLAGTRILMAARTDIMPVSREAADMLGQIASALHHNGCDTAVVVSYHTSPSSNAIPLVNAILDVFPLVGLGVNAPIYVTGDPASGEATYACLSDDGSPDCTGVVPTPIDIPHAAVTGSVRHSRADLVASVEPGPRATAVGQMLAALTQPVEPDDAEATIQLLLDTPTEQLPDADMATAAHVIRSSTSYRDRVLSGNPLTLPEGSDLFDGALSRLARDSSRVTRLVGLVSCLPDADAGECLEALAALAYLLGDGALAQIALDRARRAGDLGALGQLVDRLLTEGISPRGLLG